ncbi:MAG: hypothetical protein ABTQ25_12560 [Nitrosomonas ureae]
MEGPFKNAFFFVIVLFCVLASDAGFSYLLKRSHILASNSRLVSFGSATAQTKIDMEAMRERAKNRTYPGGADEENLQVQATLVVPERKINVKAIQSEILKIKIQDDEEPQSDE